jgi:hypothetical protein
MPWHDGRQAERPAAPTPRIIARGDGWTVADVVCTSGPQDRPFEERHTHYTIAIVLAGSFQYRSDRGRGLMTSGSLMLGNEGDCFVCGHQHGEGDRCCRSGTRPITSSGWRPMPGAQPKGSRFQRARCRRCRCCRRWLRAQARAPSVSVVPWEELAVTLAVRTVKAAAGISSNHDSFRRTPRPAWRVR